MTLFEEKPSQLVAAYVQAVKSGRYSAFAQDRIAKFKDTDTLLTNDNKEDVTRQAFYVAAMGLVRARKDEIGEKAIEDATNIFRYYANHKPRIWRSEDHAQEVLAEEEEIYFNY